MHWCAGTSTARIATTAETTATTAMTSTTKATTTGAVADLDADAVSVRGWSVMQEAQR